MTQPAPLPMVVPDCGLGSAALAAQVDRYRRLMVPGATLHRTARRLTVTFAADPEPALLDETIAVERGCCAFFALDYDPGRRRLTIAVANPERTVSLDALQAALATVSSPA